MRITEILRSGFPEPLFVWQALIGIGMSKNSHDLFELSDDSDRGIKI